MYKRQAINQLAAYSGADLDIILLSDGQATADITVGPAMSEQECLERPLIVALKQ